MAHHPVLASIWKCFCTVAPKAAQLHASIASQHTVLKTTFAHIVYYTISRPNVFNKALFQHLVQFWGYQPVPAAEAPCHAPPGVSVTQFQHMKPRRTKSYLEDPHCQSLITLYELDATDFDASLLSIFKQQLEILSPLYTTLRRGGPFPTWIPLCTPPSALVLPGGPYAASFQEKNTMLPDRALYNTLVIENLDLARFSVLGCIPAHITLNLHVQSSHVPSPGTPARTNSAATPPSPVSLPDIPTFLSDDVTTYTIGSKTPKRCTVRFSDMSEVSLPFWSFTLNVFPKKL